MNAGKLEASVAQFEKLVEESPYFTYGWFVLGTLREELGRTDAAVTAFRQALKLDAADPFGAALRLDRLGAEKVEAMPEAFVRTMFDQYAARFDADLTQTLSYRGPALLRAAIERVCTARQRSARFSAMLDLGCGTGLAGAEFRPVVDRLAGVDLSPAMIDIARGKGTYDWLEADDIVRFLAAAAHEPARYDLVLAADVFAYFADLTPVLTACVPVLERDGLVAFTVEHNDGDSYELRKTNRYVHGEAHLRAALGAAGLAPIELSKVSTRTEAGTPVPGILAIAERS